MYTLGSDILSVGMPCFHSVSVIRVLKRLKGGPPAAHFRSNSGLCQSEVF